MAIITISRGSYSKGREVAEKTAAQLGYDVISRDVLLEASDRFHTPEIKLVRAIHDAPSILDRFTHGKQCYIAYIQSALVSRAVKDNLVYHGLAGHLLLKGIPHVLRVRIIANLEDRVAAEMEREGISAAKARSLLLKDDAERRKWTQSLYGVDPWDPSLYDLVIHVDKLSVDDAVDVIVEVVKRPCFHTTPEAQQKIEDLALACQIKASLVEDGCVEIKVACEYGNVVIYTKQGFRHGQQLKKKLRELRQEIAGINNIEIYEGLPQPPHAV